MNYKKKSFELRQDVLKMVYNAKAGHIGGDFSVMDILVALYYGIMDIDKIKNQDPDRDYFILSKGHSVESYYAILADLGFIDRDDIINNFSKFNTPYIGHPNNKLPGIEMNSGSLGHGLPVGVGIALGNKMFKRDNMVYVVMGDGEMAEGSIWEAFMSGSHYKLNNLCAFIDRNRLQISGSTEDVMHHDDLKEKISAFGWNVIEVNGNNIKEIINAIKKVKEEKDRPSLIIANTIKGYGISYMENQASWHHKVPTETEFISGLKELEERSKQYE